MTLGQTPRIPLTSVLGHCMLVACLMLFFSRTLKACDKRLYNNFFEGLFHDLPEAFVGDIISPVKRATLDLPDIVKKIEGEVCSVELYPKFSPYIADDLRYLLGDVQGIDNEFLDRIKDGDSIKMLQNSEDINQYNSNEYSPVDGKLIKVADDIAAFLEADQSIKHGVSSRHLQDGLANIRMKYLKWENPQGLDVRRFFMESC